MGVWVVGPLLVFNFWVRSQSFPAKGLQHPTAYGEAGSWGGGAGKCMSGRGGPYPQQDAGYDLLLQEIRAGNKNVDDKFTLIKDQFAAVQVEISQIKADMVTKSQFESLEVRVSKLESGVGSKPNMEVKSLHLQLDRLDPANRSLAIHGICDIDLARRTRRLEAILAETVGCPKCVGIDHVHRGKRDERTPTKVSILEFRNRNDREVALQLLSPKQLQDDVGSKLVCKRARTGLQRQRNDKLVKASDALKQRCTSGEKVEIDWKERRVLVAAAAAYVQARETTEGSFLPPFANMNE